MRTTVALSVCVCILCTVSLAATQAPAWPHWIWASGDREAGRDITLETSFDVTVSVSAATLHLSADFTRCRVELNDRTLVELDEYGPWLELDVTESLRRGANSIRLHCVSGDGPAAIALSLNARLSDGTSITVVSDPLWKVSEASGENATSAGSFGPIAGEFRQIDGGARISAFDNYEQWKQATGADADTDPVDFVAPPDFEVERVRSAGSDEGSWISMAFDPLWRLTIGREDKGLLRMTLDEDGRRVIKMESIDESLLEPRGLLYAHGALYANANNSKAMYRLRDTNGDDQFDEVKTLREFPGAVGHGRNDLTLGPNGMIYSIHGDSVELAKENILDWTSPFRDARRGQSTTEGCLVRTDKDGGKWELIAAGLRNPYGIGFNTHGEFFTWDADAEFDMGSPWYRPTRIYQLVSGADFGWRGRTGDWPPWFPDHADNALPVVDVGKGSPTAIKSGRLSSFPDRFRKAIFALDWAYGRVLVCHLSPRGAGYACRVKTFLQGRPLNVTDIDFGPDGDMYLITGGRKTQSALYRIRYTGSLTNPPQPTKQQLAREAFSSRARIQRRQLAKFHTGHDRQATSSVWPFLGHPDPVLRDAARIAVEHQPVDEWKRQALIELDHEIAATALLALARSRDQDVRPDLLARLNELSRSELSASAKLSLIQAFRLCLSNSQTLDERIVEAADSRLLDWFRQENSITRASIGCGEDVHRELGRITAERHVQGAVPALITMLRSSLTQRTRMHALFLLRDQKSGWSMRNRQRFFESLRELDRSALSGQGMPGFLRSIRDDSINLLTDEERGELGELLERGEMNTRESLIVSRPFVHEWRLVELEKALSDSPTSGDAVHGEQLFSAVRCVACHRMRGRGGVTGPDLSSVARRFSRKDILASIVEPSRVITDKYRGTQIVTVDGRVINGRVITGGDFRSSVLKIVEDPFEPGKVTEVPKSNVETHRPAETSTMPKGLLNSLTEDEVMDLLAYLTNGR